MNRLIILVASSFVCFSIKAQFPCSFPLREYHFLNSDVIDIYPNEINQDSSIIHKWQGDYYYEIQLIGCRGAANIKQVNLLDHRSIICYFTDGVTKLKRQGYSVDENLHLKIFIEEYYEPIQTGYIEYDENGKEIYRQVNSFEIMPFEEK